LGAAAAGDLNLPALAGRTARPDRVAMPLAFEWWIALVFFVGTGPAIDTTSYSTAIANRSEFTIVVAPVDSKRIPAIGQIGGSQARALAPGITP
jgi:hypothetical protein